MLNVLHNYTEAKNKSNYLKIMCDLQWSLPSLQLSAVLRGEIADLAQALALPPVRVGGIDHGDLVASLQVQLVGVARLKVVQDHVQVCWQESLVLLYIQF